MKILIISPAPPNYYHRNRLLHIVKALSKDHKISIASIRIPNHTYIPYCKENYSVLKPVWKCYTDCLLNISKNIPLEVSYGMSKKFNKLISQIHKQFDIIIVKRLRALQYIPKHISTPVILDTTDAMSLHYQQLYTHTKSIKRYLYYNEWSKYLQYEKQTASFIQNWIVSSPEDKKYLKKRLPKINIYNVPNVVDINNYPLTSPIPKKKLILFFGLLDKEPNIQAVQILIRDILPKVKASIPNVKLLIAGYKPSTYLYNLTKHLSYVHIAKNVNDMRICLIQSRLVVVPLIVGTGTRNKILQSWASHRPVVTTSIGKKGLLCKNNTHILVSNSYKKFASHVITLLKDDNTAQKIAKNAYNLVKENYSLPIMRANYNRIIKKVS